jgi:hypothetical protein
MIGISQVLNRINVTYDQENNPSVFSLKFVKDDGSIRTIAKASKAVKHGKIGGGKGEKSKFKYNQKEKGTILICDSEAKSEKEKFKSVKISTIIGFNGMEVHH